MFFQRGTKKCALIIAVLEFAALLGCGCAAPVSSGGIPDLLITEVSAHDPEFVELYNPTDQEVSLKGFWFCYYPSNRDSWKDPWRKKEFAEEATIQPHGYFLLTFGEEAPGSGLLVDWNVYSGKMIKDSAGTVAVLNGAPGQGEVIDAVGWGASRLSLGSPASAAPEGWAVARKPGVSENEPFQHTGDNGADFWYAPPAPSSAVTGAILVPDDSQVDRREIEFASLTLCNTSPGSRSFSIHVESDIGLRAIRQPSSVILGPGECTRVVIHPATYELYSVDLETSGLDPRDYSIIEVAWACFRCGKLVQTYSSLVHLDGELAPHVTELTGITSKMLETAPESGEVIPLLFDELDGKPVLCYSQNRFDQRFLEAAAQSLQLEMPDIHWINVLPWAREALPALPNHKLETVTEALGIEGRHHRALSDALMTGHVFLEVVRRVGSLLLVTILPEGTVFPVAAVSLPVDSSSLSCGD